MKNKSGAIEIGLFSIASMVFLNSVYSLLTNGRFLEQDTSHKQFSASISKEDKAILSIETKCAGHDGTFETAAIKVRISGLFCGNGGRQVASNGEAGPDRPVDSKIENTTTKYTATVFNDFDAGRFSTDFMALSPGLNTVRMEFRYSSGKTYPMELSIMKK